MKEYKLFTNLIIEDLVNFGKVVNLLELFNGLSDWKRQNKNLIYPLDKLILVITPEAPNTFQICKIS